MDFHPYGKRWSKSKAIKLVPGISKNVHYSGGDTWNLPFCPKCQETMHLILNLNLKDYKLDFLDIKSIEDFPIVSCLNCSLMWEPQIFEIDASQKKVTLVSYQDEHDFFQDDTEKVPRVIPEKRFKLEAIPNNELPTSELNYDNAFESFGSEYFVRISDMPLCAQNFENHTCELCGDDMKHIVSITSEPFDDGDPMFFEGYKFLIGDVVLYFWLCEKCKRIQTEMQSI